MKRPILFFVCALLMCAQSDSLFAKSAVMRVYVGTYTGGDSKGIYVCQLNMDTGELSDLILASESKNPSFLALHPSGKFLYAVGELDNFQGRKTGAVSAFKIDPTNGQLDRLNAESSSGRGPCHLIVDSAGRHVLVANYGAGSVSAIAINDDGSLGRRTGFSQHLGSSVNTRRQEAPHAHSINLDAANNFAFAADLGIDQVVVYAFDKEKGTLTTHGQAKVTPGSGPRHFAFHPNGKRAFVINELSLTVTNFEYDATAGKLNAVQTISTLPKDAKGNNFSTAEIQVHPSGNFVYGSNRGHHSIAVFKLDETGRLSFVEAEPTGGQTPRNFGLDPTGKFLLAANQSSNDIFVFRIDAETGELSPTGHSLKVPTPVCVRCMALDN